jgi:hypothetical protein
MNGRIWLGETVGTLVELDHVGRSLYEEDFEIKREGRVSNGDYVCDIIATKKRFQITWEKMPETTLEALLVLFNLGVVLILRVERADLSTEDYNVKFQGFGRTRFLARLAAAGDTLWDTQPITFEEI